MTTRFSDVRDLWRRSGAGPRQPGKARRADAFRSLGLDRRQALWEVRGLPKEIPLPLFDHADTAETGAEPEVALPVMPLSEHVVNDYRTLASLPQSPPDELPARPRRRTRASSLAPTLKTCARRRACQRRRRHPGAPAPGLGAGVVFMTIEDETGVANAVIWPKVLERSAKW